MSDPNDKSSKSLKIIKLEIERMEAKSLGEDWDLILQDQNNYIYNLAGDDADAGDVGDGDTDSDGGSKSSCLACGCSGGT